MNAIRLSVKSAANRLESIGVLHVDLLGKDLRSLEFEGQSLRGWVTAKNKPRSSRLVVKEDRARLRKEPKNGCCRYRSWNVELPILPLR